MSDNVIRHNKSRGKFHYDAILGEWVDEEFYRDYQRENPPERKAPMVIMDTMTPTQHMVDCKFYDSKSAFRAATKKYGYVETGVQPVKQKGPRTSYNDAERAQLRADVEKSVQEVKYNQAPLTELDKERCKIINRQMRNK